jgi:hypothetical protein
MFHDQLQKLSDVLSSLPKQVQDLLIDLDVETTISRIGNTYDLTLEEIGHIYEEVAKRMKGETPMEDFFTNIQSKLAPENRNNTKTVVEDINREIFMKIRDAVKHATTNVVRLNSDFAPEHEPELKREDLLAHMENPEKIIPKVTIDLTIPEIEASKQSLRNINIPSVTPPVKIATAPANLPISKSSFTFAPPVKNHPGEKSADIPPIKVPASPATSSLLGEKLSKPSSLSATRSEYNVDPYREQTK